MNNQHIDVAKHYHEVTKLFYLQLESKPSATKHYPAQPQLLLPTDFPSPALSTLEAIAGAASPAGRATALDKASLAALCFYAVGRIRTRAFQGAGEVHFRAASSAGGLYPIETYVVCGDLSGLAAGVYHFSSADFALRLLRQGDYRAVLAQATGGAAAILSAPVTLVFSSVFWRSAWKYRVRSYRYCFWDNGTILANLLATATALGQPAQVLMGFVDAQVNHLLGLGVDREACTCLVSIGQAVPVPASAPTQVMPLQVETAPDARDEIEYPEITALHAASALTSAEQVLAWQGVEAAPPRPVTGAGYALETTIPAATSLAETIRQRGSTRRFAREAMTFAQLSAILVQSTTGIPADFLPSRGTSLLDVYLIVNAVDGLPAGSYVFSPAQRALMALRAGDFREEAGHLCFEQALGADASAVVFFLADLQEVLASFGNRGYRAVQLEAGAVGGNMYLGAYAMGLGASGLTFYDDEVTTYFSPHAAGKSAIFVVALGKTARENRVRPFRSRVGMTIDAMSRRDDSGPG